MKKLNMHLTLPPSGLNKNNCIVELYFDIFEVSKIYYTSHYNLQ